MEHSVNTVVYDFPPISSYICTSEYLCDGRCGSKRQHKRVDCVDRKYWELVDCGTYILPWVTVFCHGPCKIRQPHSAVQIFDKNRMWDTSQWNLTCLECGDNTLVESFIAKACNGVHRYVETIDEDRLTLVKTCVCCNHLFIENS